MAMIYCYECGWSISSQAPLCPKCGAPAPSPKDSIMFCDISDPESKRFGVENTRIPKEWFDDISKNKERLSNIFRRGNVYWNPRISRFLNPKMYFSEECSYCKLPGCLDSSQIGKKDIVYCHERERECDGDYVKEKMQFTFFATGFLNITEYSSHYKIYKYQLYGEYIVSGAGIFLIKNKSLYQVTAIDEYYLEDIKDIVKETEAELKKGVKDKTRCPKCRTKHIKFKGLVTKKMFCANCNTYWV